MAGVNKVILIGNLGNDPETFTFENGNKKVSFRLATTESFKNKDGQRQDVTEWHNLVLYRGLADVAEKYLRKGSSIFVEGKIKYRSWEDAGVKKYMTEIEVQNMTMLGSKPGGGEGMASAAAVSSAPTNMEEPPVFDNPSDDLPF